jgi:hypothetical protein
MQTLSEGVAASRLREVIFGHSVFPLRFPISTLFKKLISGNCRTRYKLRPKHTVGI